MNIGIHCKAGALWDSQSMQELAPGMGNVLPFLIRDAALTSSPKTMTQNASIHITHSCACCASSMTVSSNTQGFKITKI